MSSPEGNILARTHSIVSRLAASRQFVAAPGEVVRSVSPAGVKTFRAAETGRTVDGIRDLVLPGILIALAPVESFLGLGLNCADDEAVRVSIQILDNVNHSHGRDGRLQTYLNWMELIRKELLVHPNPFLQDADVTEYDPYVVHILKRLPAEAQSLVRHNQQVAMLNFQVMVRHHR